VRAGRAAVNAARRRSRCARSGRADLSWLDRAQECPLLGQDESPLAREPENPISASAMLWVPSCGRKYPSSSPPQRGMIVAHRRA
jgi:hypothetical protein